MPSSYFLPGEHNSNDHHHHPSSSIVHTHGIFRTSSTSQDAFISVPRIYEPKENDFVIGIVIVRTPDLFLVDINSSESAILPIPSFDSGRLPARHAMNRLSVVFARVVRNDSWTQTELSCQSTDRSKKKFEFGHIDQGNILRCSLSLCEKFHRSRLLHRLTSVVPNLRIRIARNGFIWYMTDTINAMIAVKNVLYEHEFDNDIEHLIHRYHCLMSQLQQQDDSLIKVKQQKTGVERKKVEPTISSDNSAVSRLLHQVIRSVLEKIIDDIETNENK